MYVDQIEFDSDEPLSLGDENAKAGAMLGEPYLSGFNPKQIANDLMYADLELIKDLDGLKTSERYSRIGADALKPPASLQIGLACVLAA